MAWVSIEQSELNELYKEAHEESYSQKIKDLLIELGANPNVIGYSIYDIITMTPGMAFEVFDRERGQKEPNIELIKNIVEHSVIDVNVQDSTGMTALMWASRGGRSEVVKMLLERLEIDVNLQDEDGWTALMIASANGHAEIVRLLLEHPKIDKTIKSRNKTAWGFASDSLREKCPDLQPNRKSTTKINLKNELLNAIESGKDIDELKKMLQ